MVYLLLAIASSTVISLFMRIGEKHIKNQMGMFMANYAACIFLSLLMKEQSVGFGGEKVGLTVLLGSITGFLYLAGFILMKYNMKHNGMVLTSTFMKLGVLIPTLMAVMVFHEVPSILQTIGIILALVAIVMIHFEKEAVQSGGKKIWLLIVLIFAGTGDSMSNVFEQIGNPEAKDVFLFITFLAAFLIALILALASKTRVSPVDLFFGVLLGIPNYFSSRFLLLALGEVPAVLAYPIYSLGTIVAIALIGVIFFKEKISKKKGIALGLIMLALVLLNL